jgi:hypothetical protein
VKSYVEDLNAPWWFIIQYNFPSLYYTFVG